MCTEVKALQATLRQYVCAFWTDATAAPELGPDTGQPVSVTQTHLPGATALTWVRVASTADQKVSEAEPMAAFWK